MKKSILFSLLIASYTAFSQTSVTISADTQPPTVSKTDVNKAGFEHTNGVLRMNTYIKSESSVLTGWLQTATNHSMALTTNAGAAQVLLNTNGNTIINPRDGKTGNVGIGLLSTDAPAQKLSVAGNILSSGLAGTGNRPVYANASGTLYAETRTFTMVVPPQGFQRRNNTGGGSLTTSSAYSGCEIVGTNINEDLVAPIILPAGVVITKVEAFFIDSDATNNLRFVFLSSPLDVGYSTTFASLFQNTNNDINVNSLASGTLSHTVDAGEAIFVLVLPVNSTGEYGYGRWNYTGGSTNLMSVKGIRVTYQLP